MEALRSTIMSNNADNIEDKPSLGGMYGSDGFFFQQRRGHLNLRSLANINLEKLVREVDVDILQIHIENITFCNLREEDLRYLTDPQIVKLFRISQLMLEYLLYSQDKLVENLNSLSQKYSDKKRGLSKKRRELAELEESTKLLRNQVKAKKQNISTLEDLLKEANRTREKELRKLKLQKGADIPDSSPPIVKFFIAGPEGLCVEFVEKSETTIIQLIREARKAFISKRDQDTSYDQGMVDLRLVFKGRLLLPEQTIEECEIRTGDTLMAMLVEKKKPDSAAPAAVAANPQTSAVDHEAFTKQMFELITKQNQEQMRDIVQDINAGWKTALETISANSRPTIIEREPVQQSQQGLGVDPQVLLDMNSKWSRSQLDLQAKLDEMAQKQAQSDQELSSLAVLAARRRLRLGDMEDDSDDLDRRRSNNNNTGLDPGMFMGRIERVEHQSTYTSLDVERMKAELDALRRQLAERPIYVPTPVQVPVPMPVVEAPKPKEMKVSTVVQREEVVTRSNKWDHLVDVKAAGAAAEATKVKGTAKAVVFEMETPAPVKQEPLPAKPVIVEKPKPAPKPKPATPPPVEEPPVEREVDLLFPAQFNPQLAVLLFTKEDFKVTVPADIPIDDLLFEVRKAASTKTRTKFAKVVMEFHEKRVLMGSDMGDEAANMTAATAKKLIASGDLRIGILPGNPLTNAQIDMLAPTWEKNKVFATAASREGALAMESGSDKAGGASKHKLRKRRNWDDEEPDAGKAGTRKSATFDDANDHDFSSEPGALPKGVYRQMRSSLDEALSEISEREGMTDEELQLQRAKLKDVTDSFPKHVTDHLKLHKGTVAGALAAAAADSGSDSGPGNRRGADDQLRTSGSFSGRNSLDRSVSRSMSLSRKDNVAGQSGGMLRLSPGPNSPGDTDRSVTSHGSLMRRSLEQFHQEDDLHSMSDDAPMLASITSSSDFRRRAGSPSRPVSVPSRDVVRDTGVGIAHTASVVDQDEDRSVTSANAPLASASLNADSLMYSPSVSVSNTARSRYSTEEAENSDMDDSFSDRRPLPTSAVQAQRLSPQKEAARGQGSKLDLSADEPIVTRWSSAARGLDDTVESLEEDPELRADSKRGARVDAGGKAADSVDSFKREYLAGHNQAHGAGFKGEMSVTESGDRFRNTGDHTMMSSIPTLNDSVNSFSDQEPDYYKDRRNLGSTLGSTLGATSSTGNTDDMLSTTLDSDGEMLLTRNEREQDRRGGGAHGAMRAGEIGRRADAYERDARGGHSKSNVEHFGHHHTGDDEASINSLALSDSNNLDDL